MERGFPFFGGVMLLSSSGRDPLRQRGTQTSSLALPATHPFLLQTLLVPNPHYVTQWGNRLSENYPDMKEEKNMKLIFTV